MLSSTLNILTAAAGLALAWALFRLIEALFRYSKLRRLPTIGPSGFLTSYVGALRWSEQSGEIVHEGYEMYRGRAFKIPLISNWMVVLTTSQMVDELRKAPDEYLSLNNAVEESLQRKYTLGPEMALDGDFHIDAVKSSLTKNMTAKLPEIRDEIVMATAEIIPAGDDWVSLPALPTLMRIVSRASNRTFVGLPLCRDPRFTALTIRHTMDVFTGARLINRFPDFLKPLVAHFFTNTHAKIKEGMQYIGPILDERFGQEAEHGQNWPDRPNDMITWLLDSAPLAERTVRGVTVRILTVNMAAIHTSSGALLTALYNVATRPELVPVLREEIEQAVSDHGWTKTSIGKMRKLDSVIKESQRVVASACTCFSLAVRRTALKDFTFSDGTVVPAGCSVAVAQAAIHCDDGNYEDGEIFKPLRFAEMRDSEGEGLKHQMTTPTPTFLAFGAGRHACPGRFFAALELKATLAHLLMAYDLKMPDGHPPIMPVIRGYRCANPTGHVLFRKRSDVAT
ncbi:cytochrome P450 [Mycena floridula]|nr:cytochrome P450 [Mycena floridula]